MASTSIIPAETNPQNTTTNTNSADLIILLVDDDWISLQIVATVVRKLNCGVVAVNKPETALQILGKRHDINLVISDLHMPVMSGIELKKKIYEEFKLPVIIMSGDYRNESMMSSLESGVSFYLMKPMVTDDLKNLRQYANALVESAVIDQEIRRPIRIGSSTLVDVQTDIGSSTPVENNTTAQKPVVEKKTRVSWTPELKDLFLKAINFLTPEKAVPKNILQYMNVPGLTRENVASRLQKHRQYSKRTGKDVPRQSNHFRLRGQKSTNSGHNSRMSQNARKNKGKTPAQPLTKAKENASSSLNATNTYDSSSGFGSSYMVNDSNLFSSNLSNANSSMPNTSSMPLFPQQAAKTRDLNFGCDTGNLSQTISQPWNPNYKINSSNPPAWNDNNSSFNFSNVNGIGTLSDGLINNCGTMNNMINAESVGFNYVGFGSFDASSQFERSEFVPGQGINSNIQFPSTVAGAYDGASSLSGLPPLPEQITAYDINDGGFQLDNNDFSPFDNIIPDRSTQLSSRDDVTAIVLEGTGIRYPDQASGGQVVSNPNFTGNSSSSNGAVNPTNNQSAIPQIYCSDCVGDNPPRFLEQPKENEEPLDLSVDDFEILHFDDAFPIFGQNANQPNCQTVGVKDISSDIEGKPKLDEDDFSGWQNHTGGGEENIFSEFEALLKLNDCDSPSKGLD